MCCNLRPKNPFSLNTDKMKHNDMYAKQPFQKDKTIAQLTALCCVTHMAVFDGSLMQQGCYKS